MLREVTLSVSVSHVLEVLAACRSVELLLREQGIRWIARVDREVLATLAAESTPRVPPRPRLLQGRTAGPVFLPTGVHRSPAAEPRPRATSTRPSDGVACPTHGRSTCSSRHRSCTTRTAPATPCTSSATHLGEHNVPLQTIMAKTRHRNPRTAMRYIRPSAQAVAHITKNYSTSADTTPDPPKISRPPSPGRRDVLRRPASPAVVEVALGEGGQGGNRCTAQHTQRHRQLGEAVCSWDDQHCHSGPRLRY
jgi:hypothetical protein